MAQTDLVPIFTAVMPVIAAIIAFILLQTLGSWIERRRLRIRSIGDLIAECKQNLQHQVASTYISLEEDAFKRFRLHGFLTEQKEPVQRALRSLYARIHEKNELILSFRDALPSGHEVVVVNAEGKEPMSIKFIIAKLTMEIRLSIDLVLPELERIYVKAKDP